MSSHIKTYDGSEDLEDHLKIFQAAAKTERWAMPTWCHMFNSMLIENVRVLSDDLPAESIDIYDDQKKAFLYKLESRDVKGAPECMRIFEFVHGITNPELIKRLHDKIPKTVDEMMRVTTSFLRGEVAASNHERKKSFPPWKQQEGNQKQNFKKGGFRSQQRPKRKQDRFTLVTKTPKEIFTLEKGKFKAPPPMKTPVEKRNHAKFCELHGEVRHNTNECMHLKRQIEEMLKAGKLSHLVKELKQNNGKEQPKEAKKEETSGKDKALVILMPTPSGNQDQLIQVTTPLIGFSGEIIWPIGQIQLLKIGDEEHSTSAWMNFVVVRSPSPSNGIIKRPGLTREVTNSRTAKLPMLAAPMEKEELIVYLAAAKETVSAVLVTEREAKQMPIYFVSRALREDSPDTLMEEEEELPKPWILFTDGSSCTDGSGAGLILTNPEGMEFTYALRFRFDATNNEAKYEALIAGLRIAEQMGVKNIQANVDS
ncbi:reverse transcriptase domain-containing protein [Tanacetum coccineum]